MNIIQFTLDRKQKKLTLNVDSNHQLNFSFEYLRVFSPVETKTKNGVKIPEVFHKKEVQLTDIEPLGKYGHRLVFDDKHSAIFTDQTFKNLFDSYDVNWQNYCRSLTTSQNREASISFVEVK
ncbi:gamma-butyrobetaine hydroxylase-like domain-containing protein [Colwellia hornerae]|uniref:DUF971 domain-containing protein n=1 Tax=Colwellia hornerae TaxID=89402 RepID=A0A5C6QGB9_9GAMM|nr:gamma-butyrobetaine hydroxylase-like domain-containing protein [Colwellia hornerae]TWX55276.1 DUF971 domain-containing protein [Colwellia hornerae]TWX61276.1 DUF971 domain-containing protein [Colwellia hornerae]TWX67677.1 DUF971 domain-containing protein [Colwellia hornerae]